MEELINLLGEKLNPHWTDYVTSFLSVVSLIIFYCTYRLARKVEKKINKPIYEKHLGEIFSFLEELNNIPVDIVKGDSNVYDLSKSTYNFFSLIDELNGEEYNNSYIIGIEDDHDLFKLMDKYRRNPIIPDTIIKKFQSILNFSDIDHLYNIYLVTSKFARIKVEGFNKNNFKRIELKKFVKNVRDFEKSLHKWINEPKIDLNLRF